MAVNKSNVGSYGWFGLWTFVVVWDFLAKFFDFEMLTTAWRRWLEDPHRRWLVGVSWLFTTKHLFFGNILPWLDPFAWVGALFGAICSPFRRD